MASAAQLEVAAAICHAMSDPARLRLLLWLVDGERCVSELVQYEQAKLSSVSARLQTLHAARLITRRREAKHVFYALADEHVRGLLHNILTHAAEAA
jgi:ArsR family transcriptional regulator